jgi:predicted DsbA family dithiol-disulfide isomerase
VEIVYRAFFLNPTIPPEGYSFAEYMHAKGGGRMPLEQFFAGPRQMGLATGLIFNFEQITKAPNSLLSHALINLAPATARDAVIEAVYAAYFEFGRDIGDLETLVEIGAEQGMERVDLRTRLAAGEGRAQAEADARWAATHGINGVPFFIIDGKYAFSGAQPPEAIQGILARVG